MAITEAVHKIVNKRKGDGEKETVPWERTIMSGIKLGSVDVGSNTRRREGEVGGQALFRGSSRAPDWPLAAPHCCGEWPSGKTQARGVRKAVHPGYSDNIVVLNRPHVDEAVTKISPITVWRSCLSGVGYNPTRSRTWQI